jgi:hypothetical protein
LRPVVGKSQQGVEYRWKFRGQTHRVRIHDRDPSVKPTALVPHPNALVGWIVRISRSKDFMDAEGRFHHRSAFRPNNPSFDEVVVNETHVPIVPPATYP